MFSTRPSPAYNETLSWSLDVSFVVILNILLNKQWSDDLECHNVTSLMFIAHEGGPLWMSSNSFRYRHIKMTFLWDIVLWIHMHSDFNTKSVNDEKWVDFWLFGASKCAEIFVHQCRLENCVVEGIWSGAPRSHRPIVMAQDGPRF